MTDNLQLLVIADIGAREKTGQAVANYFDNLLPDNDRIRQRLGRRFRTRDTDAFTLLQAIGRDCVGAVQLLPEGIAPDGRNKLDVTLLSHAQVGRILGAVPSEPASDDIDDELFRISVAGAQEKTALVR